MKSSGFIFILCIISNIISDTISHTDKCSGRWQILDKLNIRITLDWQILPLTNLFVSEFRTNLVSKGFWYAFGISSSLNKPEGELVYALRWRENDTQIFWDTYNVTKSSVTILNENISSLITFQRSISSGVLTFHINNFTSLITGKQCLYFVYMRGRFEGDTPLIPDEIRFNRSLCLTCPQFEIQTTIHSFEFTSTMENTISQSVQNLTTENITSWNRYTSISTTLQSLSRPEVNFFWIGRIVNRLWLDDYLNLSSSSSENLRIDLQNLFLSLINHTFISNQFQLYSLQSGSIIFAINITLISNLSENQTINTIEELVDNSKDFTFYFDLSSHRIIRSTSISQINILLKNLLRTVGDDLSKQAEIDSPLRLLIAFMISLSSLMILITTILCLYGYYKCRRRQYRLFTDQQTFKFKYDINSFTWLGQHPSITSSSPYLIQSTSI